MPVSLMMVALGILRRSAIKINDYCETLFRLKSVSIKTAINYRWPLVILLACRDILAFYCCHESVKRGHYGGLLGFKCTVFVGTYDVAAQ